MYTTRYPPVTHIIFDLDGTLLDTEEIVHNILADIVKDKYHKTYNKNIRHLTAGKTMADTINIVIQECQLSCDKNEFLDEVNKISHDYLMNCELKPGASRLVKHFHNHGIPMCIATSSDMESFQLKTTNHRNIFMLLHHITCAAKNPEVKHSKPAPDVFLVAASKFIEHPRPYKCLVFEDAPAGVLAARRAGMQVVMTPDPTLPEDDTYMATIVLNSLDHFRPELFGLPSFKKSCC